MCFTVAIQRAGFRIISETHGAVLVRDAGERNTLTEIQIARENAFVALVAVDGTGALLIHQTLKFFDEAFVTFFVVRFVLQNNLALAVNRDAIVGIRQIF